MPLSQYQQTLLRERKAAQGGLIESLLDQLGRNITAGVFEPDQLTPEEGWARIVRGTPRDAISAPPPEPTLAITKPKAVGRLAKTFIDTFRNMKTKDLSYSLGKYIRGHSRAMRGLPEEALRGVRDIASNPYIEPSLGTYSPASRRIRVNPYASSERTVSTIPHEVAHDYSFFPPARLPLKVKRDIASVERIHLKLKDRADYVTFYQQDPLEVTARIMGGITKVWPSKKPIPIEAYDKLFGAAIKTSLRSFKKGFPDFYRETLKDIPWEVP